MGSQSTSHPCTHRFALSLMLLTLVSQAALAVWTSDHSVNNAVATSTDDAIDPVLIPDGVGGAFVVFQSFGVYPDAGILVQRLDGQGNQLFAGDGVDVVPSGVSALSLNFVASADGAGGVVVVFPATPSGGSERDLYAQRVDHTGTKLWADSLLVSSHSGSEVVYDVQNVGGHFAVAVNADPVGVADVYLHILNQDGTQTVFPGGVPVSTADGQQLRPAMAAHGENDVILAWEDKRAAAPPTGDIRGQRVTVTTGDTHWEDAGLLLNDETYAPSWIQMIPSPDGNDAFLVWSAYDPDVQASNPRGLWATEIDGQGSVNWLSTPALTDVFGIDLNPSQSVGTPYALISNGIDRYMVFYQDSVSLLQGFRAQVLDLSGGLQLGLRGIPVGSGECHVSAPILVNAPRSVLLDGTSALVAYSRWNAVQEYYDLYAQRVQFDGSILWGATGQLVGSADEDQDRASVGLLSPDMAVVTFRDDRAGFDDANIYAQAIQPDGTLGSPASTSAPGPGSQVFWARSLPNPTSALGSLRVHAPSSGNARLAIFDLRGRAVYRDELFLTEGENQIPLPAAFVGRSGAARGSYVLRVEMDGRVATEKLLLVE